MPNPWASNDNGPAISRPYDGYKSYWTLSGSEAGQSGDGSTGNPFIPSYTGNTSSNGAVSPVGDGSQPVLFYDPLYGDYIYMDHSGRILDRNGYDVTEAVGDARRRAAAGTGTSGGSFSGDTSSYEMPDTTTNNALSVNVDGNNSAGLMSLGQSIANAAVMQTDSTNALNKYMWEQGEANTDRRLNQQMIFTHNEAQSAMDYQERMRNTSHQAEVADLRAAGLNPVLSANNGASTPAGLMGGASAVGSNGFSAAQPNIVGAYSAAGEFVANMLNLKEQMRQYDKSFTRDTYMGILKAIASIF